MRRWAATLLIGASVAGCKVGKHHPPADAAPIDARPPPAPAVIALRAEVRAAVEVFGRRGYAPEDWTLIDPSIAWALEHGADPDSREAVIADAARDVAGTLMNQDAGIAALQRQLELRYYRPVITRAGDLVRIDLGVILGKPSRFRGADEVSSWLVDGGGLIAEEVVRNLRLGMATQPGARAYQVEVDIPGRSRKGGLVYVYALDEDRVRAYSNDADSYFVTEPLGGDLDKVMALHWARLERRDVTRMPVRSVELARPR